MPTWTGACSKRLTPLDQMRVLRVTQVRGCSRSLLPAPSLQMEECESVAFCGLAPRRRRRKPVGSTNCLVEAACFPPRQAFARRSVDTRMTVTHAKPTPFGNYAARPGHGPLGHAGLATQLDVRRSGCVCAALLRTHGCQLWVANRRLCELALRDASCPSRQRWPGNIARRPNHRGHALCSFCARRAALATQRGTLGNDVARGALRQHGR